MKVTIDLPPEVVEALRKRALDKGYSSLRDYLRILIAASVGIRLDPRQWGGARKEGSTELHEDADE